ncbi:MAG: hypothetical protein V4710_09110, partial [Verrucomicrobiota bacterium]
MKSPETPSEELRVTVPKHRSAEASSGTAEKFVPIYVQVPSQSSWHGGRNLLLGGFFFVLALMLALFGTIVSGARALLPVGTCLVAFTLLWALARIRLLKQRNGPFLALALLSVFGASVALLERGYDALAQRYQTPASAVIADVPGAAPAPAATAAPAADLPLLSKEPGVLPADAITGPSVRILADSRVMIGRKAY